MDHGHCRGSINYRPPGAAGNSNPNQPGQFNGEGQRFLAPHQRTVASNASASSSSSVPFCVSSQPSEVSSTHNTFGLVSNLGSHSSVNFGIPPPPVNFAMPPQPSLPVHFGVPPPPPPFNGNLPPPYLPPNVNMPPPPFNARVPPPLHFNPHVPPPPMQSAMHSGTFGHFGTLPPTETSHLSSLPMNPPDAGTAFNVNFQKPFDTHFHLSNTFAHQMQSPSMGTIRPAEHSNFTSRFGQQQQPRPQFQNQPHIEARAVRPGSISLPRQPLASFENVHANKLSEPSDSALAVSFVGRQQDLTSDHVSDNTAAAASDANLLKPCHRKRRKLISIMQYRWLLREAILLNEKLKKCHRAKQSDISDIETKENTDHTNEHLNDSDPESAVICQEHSEVEISLTSSEQEKRTVRLTKLDKVQETDMTLPSSLEDINTSEVKARLKEIRSQLTEALGDIQVRVKCATLKRKRLKAQRKQLYELKLEQLWKREKQKQEHIKWEKEMQLAAMNAKMEAEMKKSADATLSEVRRKISDAHQRLKLLAKLRKLRLLRRDQSERKGISVHKSDDSAFEGRISALSDFLKQQLEMYEAEQRTLQVMLETEQEETKEKEREKRQRKLDEQMSKYEESLNTWLFGKNEPLELDDPMFPYRQYYELANYSIDALVKIRQEWDMFLVPRGLPGGSSIPHDWVVPVDPTDDVWASALESNQQS